MSQSGGTVLTLSVNNEKKENSPHDGTNNSVVLYGDIETFIDAIKCCYYVVQTFKKGSFLCSKL